MGKDDDIAHFKCLLKIRGWSYPAFSFSYNVKRNTIRFGYKTLANKSAMLALDRAGSDAP
jgi:hypothetical protein